MNGPRNNPSAPAEQPPQNQAQEPNTPPVAADRHYHCELRIGPIPGLDAPQCPPERSELERSREELAAILANAEANPEPKAETAPGLADFNDLPTPESFDGWTNYTGPAKKLIPTPNVPWPSSMIEASDENPAEIWAKIDKEARKRRCALTQADAQNLWAVYTARPWKLILLVCTEADLVLYLDGRACPVRISSADAFITLTGEAQSLDGYARHGAAADTLGRLAFFDAVRSKAIMNILSSGTSRM